MATLATLTDRFVDTAESTDAVALRGNDYFRPRALANEGVYVHIKTIDNARVRREPDVQASRTCWKLIVAAGLTMILVAAMLMPTAYSLLAGYQIQKLKVEQQKQLQEQNVLDQEVAALLSPERLASLAEQQSFTDPTPDKMVYLNPRADGKMAMNRVEAEPAVPAQE